MRKELWTKQQIICHLNLARGPSPSTLTSLLPSSILPSPASDWWWYILTVLWVLLSDILPLHTCVSITIIFTKLPKYLISKIKRYSVLLNCVLPWHSLLILKIYHVILIICFLVTVPKLLEASLSFLQVASTGAGKYCFLWIVSII